MTMSRDAAAYHEAGHAVVAWALGCIVRLVTIDADGGRCECEDPPEPEGKLVLCFAGPASQRTHGPVESWHGGGDYGKAVEVGHSGISDERVRELIDKTYELVVEHWGNIGRVADALIESDTLNADEIGALLGPTPDRVKLTKQQRRDIAAWAKRARLVEAVRLFGSRAKGFARLRSDVDIAITATDGNYTRFDSDWKAGLSAEVGGSLEVRVSQYRPTGNVRDHCDKWSVLLFERPAETQGFKRPTSSRGQSY